MELEKLERSIRKIKVYQHIFYENPINLFNLVRLSGTDNLINDYLDLYLINHPERIHELNRKGENLLMECSRNYLYGNTNIRTFEILLRNEVNPKFYADNGHDCFSILMKLDNGSIKQEKYQILDLIHKYGYKIKPSVFRLIFKDYHFSSRSERDVKDLNYIIKNINAENIDKTAELIREISRGRKYSKELVEEFMVQFHKFHPEFMFHYFSKY